MVALHEISLFVMQANYLSFKNGFIHFRKKSWESFRKYGQSKMHSAKQKVERWWYVNKNECILVVLCGDLKLDLIDFLEMYAFFKMKLEWMTFKTNQGHWVVSLTLCQNLKVTINFMQIDQLLLQKCDICLLMYNLIWVDWISLLI